MNTNFEIIIDSGEHAKIDVEYRWYDLVRATVDCTYNGIKEPFDKSDNGLRKAKAGQYFIKYFVNNGVMEPVYMPISEKFAQKLQGMDTKTAYRTMKEYFAVHE